jgi:uncharacterized protein (TIGR02246 family)
MKMRSLMLIGTATLSVLLAGCQKQASAAANAGSAKDAIKSDEKKWNEQFKAKDTESLVGHYADDAYFAGAGSDPADGSTAIRKAYAATASDPNFSVNFASDKIDIADSGDLAYSRGHFTENYTDPKSSKAMTSSGSYLTVYKKQQDGSWKAVEDFTTAAAGATKPVEAVKPATRAKMTSF